MSSFEKYDKKQTQVVTEANFKTVIRQLLNIGNSASDTKVVDSMFYLAQTEGFVNYGLWLE